MEWAYVKNAVLSYGQKTEKLSYDLRYVEQFN